MMNNTYTPELLQKRKRVSSTTFGVRPMLVESNHDLFHARCKTDNLSATKVALANNIVLYGALPALEKEHKNLDKIRLFKKQSTVTVNGESE